MADKVTITECDALDEVEDGVGDLPSQNSMSNLNQEEITKWVEVDDDEATEDILTDRPLYRVFSIQQHLKSLLRRR